MPKPVSEPRPIMLRAYLTESEWQTLRRLAFERNQGTGQLVTNALHATYNLTGGK